MRLSGLAGKTVLDFDPRAFDPRCAQAVRRGIMHLKQNYKTIGKPHGRHCSTGLRHRRSARRACLHVAGTEVLLTPRQARAQGVPFRVLEPPEVATLEALGETLAIGARQNGIAHFVDQQLTVPPAHALLSLRVTEVRPPYVSFYRRP